METENACGRVLLDLLLELSHLWRSPGLTAVGRLLRHRSSAPLRFLGADLSLWSHYRGGVRHALARAKARSAQDYGLLSNLVTGSLMDNGYRPSDVSGQLA